HLDVVGVEKEKWKYDPFGAAVDDGFLYGRGAIDDKGMGALFAEIVLQIVRNKIPLKRDILYIACADEEAGGEAGDLLADRKSSGQNRRRGGHQ
ncbi:MAG: M20/M25/M40 family metallo-hydrolase, partial [Limisphaerales bacterium]